MSDVTILRQVLNGYMWAFTATSLLYAVIKGLDAVEVFIWLSYLILVIIYLATFFVKEEK